MKYISMLVALVAGIAANAYAEDYTVTLKNHTFTPAELTVPADKKIVLTVKNEDSSPAEFESHDLKREKVIKGGKTAVIKIGPLKPGRYAFEDEFHDATAQGVLIAK